MSKLLVADRTVRSFTKLDDWLDVASESNLRVTTREDDGAKEYFAEKGDAEDVTVIGYFKEDWGMLV